MAPLECRGFGATGSSQAALTHAPAEAAGADACFIRRPQQTQVRRHRHPQGVHAPHDGATREGEAIPERGAPEREAIPDSEVSAPHEVVADHKPVVEATVVEGGSAEAGPVAKRGTAADAGTAVAERGRTAAVMVAATSHHACALSETGRRARRSPCRQASPHSSEVCALAPVMYLPLPALTRAARALTGFAWALAEAIRALTGVRPLTGVVHVVAAGARCRRAARRYFGQERH